MIRAGINKASVLDGPVKLDPYLFAPDVKIKDVATGKEKIYSQHHLKLGVGTTFVPGQFYEIPQLCTYYFQHGQLFQAEYLQETKYSESYVPVTDKMTIERLQRRRQVLKAHSKG